VSTHLVQFGVIVRDKHGPVTNLTKDDFVVLERGKPRPINVFAAESSASPAPPAAAESAPLLPPNTFSDHPQSAASQTRSVTIVLLDNLNTLYGSDPEPYEGTPLWVEDHALTAAKKHLLEFLQQMDPQDRIAIYGLTDQLRVLCDFTCDRDRLRAVVGHYDATSRTSRGLAEPGAFHFPNMPNDTVDDQATADGKEMATLPNDARANLTLTALTAIAAHVAGIPGRKNLLWLTANLPFSGDSVARIFARGNIVAYPVDARGLLPKSPVITFNGTVDNGDQAEAAKMEAPLGRVQVPTGIAAMEDMAADTGGHAFVNSNDLTAAIRSVVEDAKDTYTLGFYLPASDADGDFHKLTVRATNPGLTVLYPRGYFAFKDTPATQSENRNTFLAAVRSPLQSAAIPLEIKLDRLNQPVADSLEVAGTVDIKSLSLLDQGELRKGALDVYTIEQDAAGNVIQQTNHHLSLTFTPQQYLADRQSGIRFREVIQPKPNGAILRVLVQDPGTSEIGCVIIPLAGLR
jgi:VWFA-related protein